MNLMPIISRLEQEVDVADEKMVEEYPSKYYDGYGDGLRYAINLLRKAGLNDCKQRIIDDKFQISQGIQETALLEKLKLPKFKKGGEIKDVKFPFIL